MGFMLRILLLPAYPPIFSDDIYRFLWDGWLTNQGIDPYWFTPRELFESGKFTQEKMAPLLELMNSPDYHSVYPPLSQLIYASITWPFSQGETLGPTLLLRGILIFSEICLLYLMWQLAAFLDVPKIKLIWYSLNPLVILEISGNLHFEGLVILGLATSAYFILYLHKHKLSRTKYYASSIFALAVSIGIKLTPIILIPALVFKIWQRKYLKWLVLLALMGIILFLPLLASLHRNGFFQSIDLYFRKFEFNASIYYLCRWIGVEITSYNKIATIGPVLGFISILSLLGISWFGRIKLTLAETGLFLYTSYILMSTTVHPWYIILPLFFGVFTRYTYVLVWSYTVFFSYHAYQVSVTMESIYWLLAEYIPVFLIMLFEIYRNIYSKNANQNIDTVTN